MTWFPDTSRLCDGSRSSEPTWQRDVAATGDVVIITGPMADADCVGPVTVRRSTAGRQREAQRGGMEGGRRCQWCLRQ